MKSSSSDQTTEIKIGFIRSLQMFFVDSSVIFFNRSNFHRDRISKTCAFALDIIQDFILKIPMDQNTW
jgi:hypothetical protein